MNLKKRYTDYKAKEFKGFFARLLQAIVCTNSAKFIISAALFVIGAIGVIFSEHCDCSTLRTASMIVHYSGFIFPTLYFAVSMYYAWIYPVISWVRGKQPK